MSSELLLGIALIMQPVTAALSWLWLTAPFGINYGLLVVMLALKQGNIHSIRLKKIIIFFNLSSYLLWL